MTLPCPCARSSAQDTAPSCWTRGSAAVSHTGQALTAPQVGWTLAFTSAAQTPKVPEWFCVCCSMYIPGTDTVLPSLERAEPPLRSLPLPALL